LVVEDNRLVRDGIIAMLGEQPDLKVVAAVDRAPCRARESARGEAECGDRRRCPWEITIVTVSCQR